MDKAMASGFLFLFCVVFLMIEEGSGMFIVESPYNTVLPVTLVIYILELDLAFKNYVRT